MTIYNDKFPKLMKNIVILKLVTSSLSVFKVAASMSSYCVCKYSATKFHFVANLSMLSQFKTSLTNNENTKNTQMHILVRILSFVRHIYTIVYRVAQLSDHCIRQLIRHFSLV